MAYDYIKIVPFTGSSYYRLDSGATLENACAYVTLYANQGSEANSSSTVVARSLMPSAGKTFVLYVDGTKSMYYYAVASMGTRLYTGNGAIYYSQSTSGTTSKRSVEFYVNIVSGSLSDRSLLTKKEFYSKTESLSGIYYPSNATGLSYVYHEDYVIRHSVGRTFNNDQYIKRNDFDDASLMDSRLVLSTTTDIWYPSTTGTKTGLTFPAQFSNEFYKLSYPTNASTGWGFTVYECSTGGTYTGILRLNITIGAGLTEVYGGQLLIVIANSSTKEILHTHAYTYSATTGTSNNTLINGSISFPIGSPSVSCMAIIYARMKGYAPPAQVSYLKCLSPWESVYAANTTVKTGGTPTMFSVNITGTSLNYLSATTAQRFMYISTTGFRNKYTYFFDEWFNDEQEYDYFYELVTKESLLSTGITFHPGSIDGYFTIYDYFDDNTDDIAQIGYCLPRVLATKNATLPFKFRFFFPILDINFETTVYPQFNSVSSAQMTVMPDQNFDKEFFVIFTNTASTPEALSETIKISYSYDGTVLFNQYISVGTTGPGAQKQYPITISVTTARYASIIAIAVGTGVSTVQLLTRADRKAVFIDATNKTILNA